MVLYRANNICYIWVFRWALPAALCARTLTHAAHAHAHACCTAHTLHSLHMTDMEGASLGRCLLEQGGGGEGACGTNLLGGASSGGGGGGGVEGVGGSYVGLRVGGTA